MSEPEGGEAAELQVNEAAHEAAVSSQERDYEAEARKDGWVPEDEFKGDKKPSRFKTAEEFVRDGEIIAIKREFDDRLKRMEKSSAAAIKLLEKNHEREIADLKAVRREAVKAGNVAEVERLDQAIEDKKDEAPGKEKPDQNAAFKQRNDWYETDDDLTALAVGKSQSILQAYFDKHQKPMSQEDMFEAVEKAVKSSALYKAKFPEKAANGHAAVDGGSENGGPTRSNGKTAADLPPEAKKAGAKFISQGLYKDLKEYAKDYYANE